MALPVAFSHPLVRKAALMELPIPDAPQGANLLLKIASDDLLDVRYFSVLERMSSLFTVSIMAVSENPAIDFDAVVGRPARFTIQSGLHERFWSGICSHLQQTRVEEDGASTYEITIMPELWLATQRTNYRMFQQTSEPDIVRKLLGEWGIEPEVRLTDTYKKRKYRVQYAESDYAFMCRMLEDAGISFYFVQAEGETKLVLSDAPQRNEPRAQKISFKDDTSTATGEYVTGVRVAQQVRPGRYTMQEHDYRRAPANQPASSAEGASVDVERRLERFHYTPGAFLFGTDKGEATPSADDRGKTRVDEAEASLLARKRLDAKRSTAKTCTFQTNALDLAPGVVMSMLDHPRPDLGPDRNLLVVEAMHAGTSTGADWSHTCEARSADIPYRPPLATPKPKVIGVESATVVGPPGEEIHTDEFGRVRVHFHWDRESRMDDSSSCWIHVSQPWGGAGFGGINLPRVGQEVLVDFLSGDPDRPVIVGRVYTNLQKVPYKLPESKTQSGWKSNSYPGGGGYNELRFEDAKGKEQVYIQAEKDLKKLVKNNETVTIGNNRTKLVKANDSLTVGANRTHRVQFNEQISVGINQRTSVGVNRSTQVGVIDSTVVGDTHVVTISPPGEGGGGANTTMVMKDGKIVLDTGAGAKITMDGATITITASIIALSAEAFLGASAAMTVIGGFANLTLGSPVLTTVHGGALMSVGGGPLNINSSGSMGINAAGDMSINGAMVQINGPGLFAARVTDTAPDKVTRGSATVLIGGPFAYSEPPTLDQMLEDPTVTEALDAAWNESNPNAPEVPSGQPGSQKQEQGGWIVWNKNTGRLEVQRAPAGSRAGMNPGARPADNADQQPVGWFHTHPNTVNEGYTSNPSGPDINFTNNTARVPGIVMTHDGIQTIPYP